MEDTIAGISTSLGVGAISIIRISGQQAIPIINKIFTKDLSEASSHTIHYGYIQDTCEKIDEVLVSIMKSPKTYTKEDIVEISCHGGITTTNKVLELILSNGARLAMPGEFTKRAFLNGRIDLIEANGIMNLISSKTETSRKLSINQLSGQVSNLISNIREKMVNIISNIEVNIDYPEYNDVEVINRDSLLPKLKDLKKELQAIIEKTKTGKIIIEGINVSIIGKPNVGKSSLLNCLLEEEKAIVTDIAGTTRDVVEGSVRINNILFNFYDTAGIRDTSNIIEQQGIDKSLKKLEESDLVLFMLDYSNHLTEEETELLKKTNHKKRIIIVNKIDLLKQLNLDILDYEVIKISTKTKENIDNLKNKMLEMFNLNEVEQNDINYLTDAHSISLLKKSLLEIEQAIISINNNEPIDIIELSIKKSWQELGRIIGETYDEELIDQMFSKFCLGK